MCFLDFVEQDYRVGVLADLLGELSSFFVSDISRGRSDEARDVVFLGVFAHVDSDECVAVAEHEFGELLYQVCFAHTCRSEEEEYAYRLAGVVDADTVADD